MTQDTALKSPGAMPSSLDLIVERFEDAWEQGERPAIGDYLLAADPSVPRRGLLVELVHVDLERRLKSDAHVRVESYLEQYPELQEDDADLLDLIAAEFELRMRREPGVTAEEYVRRFPRYGQELSSRLKTPSPRTRRYPLRLNCPHCENPIEIGEQSQEDVTCPLCGSTFRLDSEPSTCTWSPESLPQLGKFKLIAKVGQGTFGTVYRARDTVLGRMVAVKLPRSESFATKQDEERFEREARAAAALDHPGIVRVLELGRSQTFPYIVSEFVQGLTLADAISGRRFSFRESAELLAQVADALDHAHQHQVIHRDVKPSNIMLAVEGSGSLRPRVMDFGLARRQEGEVTMTLEGQVLGTLAYTSPEQARGEGHDADGRTDVYSVGVMLYELLTGERPFRGNRSMLLHQVIYEEPRPPRKLNDQIPRDLETITLKCMAKEPGRRYQTAGEVSADLRRWLAGEPIQARPVRTPERIWLWCRRRPAIAGLSAALVLACVLGAAGVTWQWVRAESHRREATARFQGACRTVDTFLTSTSETLKYYPGMQHARERLLARAAEEYKRFAEERSDDPALRAESGRAFIRLGDVYGDLQRPDEAVQAYRSAELVFQALIRHDPRNSEYALERANCRTKTGIALQVMGRHDEAEQAYVSALAGLRPLAEAPPQKPLIRDAIGTALVNRGLLRHAVGQQPAAEEDIQAAIREFQSLVAAIPQGGNPSDDEQRFRFALATARNYGAHMLAFRGHSAEAAAVFQDAIRDLETLGGSPAHHPEYIQARADTRNNLAAAMRSLGRNADARTIYAAELTDYQDLLKAMPDVPAFQANLGQVHLNLGQLLHELGLNPAAKPHLEASCTTFANLASEHPRVIEYRERLAIAQVSLAHAQRDLGDQEAAEASVRSAIQGFEILARADATPAHRELLAVAHSILGRVLHQAGRHEAAKTEFDVAIHDLETLAKEADGVPAFRDELAWCYNHRGDLLLDLGQADAAGADYDRVVALRQSLVNDSSDAQYAYRLAWFLANCRDPARRQPDVAIKLAKQAKDLAPANATYWNALGVAHFRAGQLSESIQSLEEAAKLRRSGHCLDWFFLAVAQSQVGEKQQAQSCLSNAMRWMMTNSPGCPDYKRLQAEVEMATR